MIRSLSAVIGFVLALAIAVAPVSAEPVVVDLRIDSPPEVTVGDRVLYTVVVETEPGTSIVLAPESLPPTVALIDAPVVTRRALPEGPEEITLSFELAPFAVGDVEVPPLVLPFTMPSGPSGVVETPASLMQVVSVLPDGAPLVPRDLKPQAEIGSPPPVWPLPVAIALVTVLVLAVVALLVRRQVRRYREAQFLRQMQVLSGPEDIARGILNHTRAAFDESGDYIRYYTSLGNTIRYYLTQRYGFPAFALTTRELEEAMVERELDRWQIRVSTGLLNQCDAVVYASYRPAMERADADLTAAYEIVEMSRPVERALEGQEEATVA